MIHISQINNWCRFHSRSPAASERVDASRRSSRTTPPLNFSMTKVSMPASPAAQAAKRPPVPAPITKNSVSMVSTISSSEMFGASPIQSKGDLAIRLGRSVSRGSAVCRHPARPNKALAPAEGAVIRKNPAAYQVPYYPFQFLPFLHESVGLRGEKPLELKSRLEPVVYENGRAVLPARPGREGLLIYRNACS